MVAATHNCHLAFPWMFVTGGILSGAGVVGFNPRYHLPGAFRDLHLQHRYKSPGDRHQAIDIPSRLEEVAPRQPNNAHNDVEDEDP